MEADGEGAPGMEAGAAAASEGTTLGADVASNSVESGRGTTVGDGGETTAAVSAKADEGVEDGGERTVDAVKAVEDVATELSSTPVAPSLAPSSTSTPSALVSSISTSAALCIAVEGRGWTAEEGWDTSLIIAAVEESTCGGGGDNSEASELRETTSRMLSVAPSILEAKGSERRESERRVEGGVGCGRGDSGVEQCKTMMSGKKCELRDGEER